MNEQTKLLLRRVADNEPVIVEFFGLPGAGKTTLANKIYDDLREQGHDVLLSNTLSGYGMSVPARLARRLCLVACEAARRPAILSVIPAVISARPGSAKELSKALSNCLTVAAIFARARRHPGITLVDQGWLNAAWSIAVFSPNEFTTEGWLSKILAKQPGADHIYFVDVPVDVAKSRLAARKSVHSRMQDPENQFRWDKAMDVTQEITEIDRVRRSMTTVI